MRVKICALSVAGLCGLAASASAQSFVNADFESGTIAGWTVTNTPNGQGFTGSVVSIDIDGEGPMGSSLAPMFSVGGVVSTGLQEGVELTQPLSLQAGVTYTIELDWLAQRQVAVGNAEGGVFSILVGGNVIASAAAGSTSELEPHPGHLSGTYTAATAGSYEVGVRITRPYLPGGLLYQYVDNFAISGGGGCYANCDGSTQEPVLNVGDFTCFLQRFAAGESYANCDSSTVVPVLNVGDFTCFLQSYATGCR
jgi:hypothetical protein